MEELLILIVTITILIMFVCFMTTNTNIEKNKKFSKEIEAEKKIGLKEITEMSGIPTVAYNKGITYWELSYDFIDGVPVSSIYFFDYPTDKFGYFDFQSATTGTIALSDINNLEVVKEYSYDSVTKTKGGITRAVVGGVLAGGAGAVVGAATANKETVTNRQLDRVYIKLNTNDIQHSTYIFNFTTVQDALEYEGIIRAIINKYGKIHRT